MHELAHVRQRQILQVRPMPQPRGTHGDAAWRQAVCEATPGYLGLKLDASAFAVALISVRVPAADGYSRTRTGKAPRPGALSEVILTHWPDSLRRIGSQPR